MELPAGVLFVANTGAAAWLSARWSRRLLPDAVGAERALATLVLFASLTQACLMALGLAGLLSASSVAALLGGLVLLDAIPGRRRAGQDPAQPEPAERWSPLALAMLTGVCGWTLWSIVGSGTSVGWDTLTYHAVSPARWIQHGSLSLVPFNYQAYYPMNAELASTWYMLAHRADTHASLAMIVWMGILVSAALLHARRLGYAPLLTAAVLSCFLLSPKVNNRLSYFTAGDQAMAGLLLAMLAFTWVPPHRGRPLARALLSGLAGGLAVGMKPTAAPFVALAGLMWMMRRRGAPGASVVARLSSFGLGVLLTGGYWYLRNLLLTGNPLFPAAIGPFEGPFTADAQRETSLMPLLSAGWHTWDMWSEVLEGYLDWPLWLGLLAVAGLLSGLWAAVREPQPDRRRHLRWLLACALAFLVLFPMQPFSGTVNRPDVPASFLPRYVTFAFLVGMLLLPSAWTMRRRPAEVVDEPRRAPRLLRLVPGLLVLAAIVGIALMTPWRRAATDAIANNILGDGWKILEALPEGTRVGVYTQDPPTHAPYYGLFGRELQLEPVAVNQDGTRRLPLHEHWREDPPSWWWEFEVADGTSDEQLVENLRAAGMQILVIQNWPPSPDPANGQFVQRQRVARALGPERVLYSDRLTEIWDLDGDFEQYGSPRRRGGRKAWKTDEPGGAVRR